MSMCVVASTVIPPEGEPSENHQMKMIAIIQQAKKLVAEAGIGFSRVKKAAEEHLNGLTDEVNKYNGESAAQIRRSSRHCSHHRDEIDPVGPVSSVSQLCEAVLHVSWQRSIFLCVSGTSDVWEVIHRAYKRSTTVRELKPLILSTRDDNIALRLLKGENAYTGTT
eukprot:GHVU01207560.1.p1 GENE.GHVU01207560.1~~GHVU01207560.1.p1  ORF type:complete len:166 (+),score=18.35 GHVU01207560.1:596-1093(+)